MAIIISVRGIIFASIILIGIGVFVAVNNSKVKSKYEKRTGKIEYFAEEYLDLPNRNKGDYRYLKIDSYDYMFEIYTANADKEVEPIDDLKIGDTIDTYFYETGSTYNEGLNRYVQFIDKEAKPYFKRGDFQKQLGYVIVGLALSLNLLGWFFWNKGKLAW